MKHPDYDFAHRLVSKGKTYWRFRKNGTGAQPASEAGELMGAGSRQV